MGNCKKTQVLENQGAKQKTETKQQTESHRKWASQKTKAQTAWEIAKKPKS